LHRCNLENIGDAFSFGTLTQTQGHLYHQRGGGAEPVAAQNRQNPGAFPNEESAIKLLLLALREEAKKWTMPIHHWNEALHYFTILWPDRNAVPEKIGGRKKAHFRSIYALCCCAGIRIRSELAGTLKTTRPLILVGVFLFSLVYQ